MHHDKPILSNLHAASNLTIEQFAEAFQVSEATFCRLHANGQRSVLPLGVGRRLHFSVTAVQYFLSASKPTKN